VQKILLEEYPDANLNIFIVWIKMCEADSIDVVQEASRLFHNDSRVTQFYDPEKICGLEVAEGFCAKSGEVAWDVYLFYDDQDEWVEQLPQPKDWVHQVRDSSWAEPGRLFQGDQLTSKLREIMLNLLQNEKDA
jgi:hypothetical protein